MGVASPLITHLNHASAQSVYNKKGRPVKNIIMVVAAGLIAVLTSCGSPSSTATTGQAPTIPIPATVAATIAAPTATSVPTSVPAPTAAPTQQAPTVAPTTVPATAVAAATSAPPVAHKTTCADVERPDPTSWEGEQIRDAAQAAIQAQSNTSDATISTLKQINRFDNWLIVQAEFDQTEPGVFLLHEQAQQDEVAAVWGGVVEHKGQIQQYFAQQAPKAPKLLLDCFQPQDPFTK